MESEGEDINFNDEPQRQEMKVDDNGDVQKAPTKAADPSELKNLKYDSITPAPTWKGIEIYGHTGLVGATNSGKSHFIKQIFADEKVHDFDAYVIVSDSHSFSDFTVMIAARRYLRTGEWESLQGNIAYYKVEDIDKAMAVCIGPQFQGKEKLIIFSDCQLTAEKTYTNMATFINKCKNYQTTAIVEIHHYEKPLMKQALANTIFLKTDPSQLALHLKKSKNDSDIKRYAALSGHDRVWIKTDGGDFNKHYLPI